RQAGILGDVQAGRWLGQVVEIEHVDGFGDFALRVHGSVGPEVLGLGVGLDEQVARARHLQFLHDLPVVFLELGVLGLVGRGGDQRYHVVAQVAGGPDGAELLVDEVGAAAGVGNLGGVDQSRQLAGLGVGHGDLVRRIGGHHEVASGCVPAAVVQELGGLDRGGLQVLQVGVVHQQDLA